MTLWASNTGSNVLTGLNVDVAAWQSGSTIRYTFSGSPNFSSVVAGYQLVISGSTNAVNDGTFEITDVNDTSDWIEVLNYARTSASADETSSPATGIVKQNAALVQEPTTAKQGAGFLNAEKPPAGYFNWLLNKISKLGGIFTLAGWKAESHSGEELTLIKGQGIYRFDPNATDEPGEAFIPQDVGSGVGVFEAAHPDSMAAMLAAFIPEILPPVQATLDFGSTAANTISTATVTVPGAKVGDQVFLGAPSTIEAGFLWSGFVSAADTVTIRLAKITTGTTDPAAAEWAVTVVRPNSMPIITTRGLKIFTNLVGGVYDSTSLETDLSIADNEAAFNLLVNSRQHRAVIADGGTIEGIVSGSATADAIMLATGGY